MRKVLIFIIFFSLGGLLKAQTLFDSLVTNTNISALNFFKDLSKSNYNEVFSPFGFTVNMTELFMASKAGTNRQIREFDGFSQIYDSTINNMIRYQSIIKKNNSLYTNFKYSFNLFVDTSVVVLNPFMKKMRLFEIYDTNYNLKFSISKDSVQKLIVKIIKNNSQINLKNIISADYLPDTPSLLVSSVFSLTATLPQAFKNFYLSDFNVNNLGKVNRNVKYFTTFSYFKYGESENYQIVDIPLENDKFSMLIILPKENEDITKYVKEFDYNYFTLWMQKSMFLQLIRLSIPKISLQSFYSLKENIDTVIPVPFTFGCNFFNFTKKLVYVNGFYNYNEFSLNSYSDQLQEVNTQNFIIESAQNQGKILEINHPFMFFIYEKSTNIILFTGYVNYIE